MIVIVLVAVVLLLIFFRMFYVLIRWEVGWDIRLLEFGFHAFLLGAGVVVGVLIYFGYLSV
ncbi:hypothetical protein A6O24_05450 [Acidithiobacillus thiooxidans]|uniref:hypothetical protein n=1 Tax=Acidithiobacillus thiooxidans TaxID=930 RepID=UPI0004649B16|nr:hypothetical protein [Acidithiobacillus thiooxidans]OCX78068.1 hypothetical protein A6O24_05450 [Acidithiobacillus thiooxidans]